MGDNSNPGKLVFTDVAAFSSFEFYSDYDGAALYSLPTMDDATTFNIGTAANSYSVINLHSGTYIDFIVKHAGAGSGMRLYTAAGLWPLIDDDLDLGTASYRWDYIYSSHVLNVADFYFLDTRVENGKEVAVDDIETIKAIGPSGKYDSHTGLMLIDDDTIPEFILPKYEKDFEEFDEDGNVIRRHKAGDIIRTEDGRPYLDTTVMLSLLMGAVRKIDARLEAIEKKGATK